MFPIVTIGYMGNNIYPARAGEVLRAYVLRREQGVPISASLATILVERIFDGVVMLMFIFFNLNALAGLTGSSGFAGSIQAVAVGGTAVFAVALLVFLLAAHVPAASRWGCTIGWWRRACPSGCATRSPALLESFWTGLAALRSPRNILMVFVTSVVIWLLETGKYWFVMHAFDFTGYTGGFFGLMLMNGIVNLATTIPSAPGYVGTFDTPGIAVLSAYGLRPGRGRRLHAHAARRAVAAHHPARRLLHGPRRPEVGQGAGRVQDAGRDRASPQAAPPNDRINKRARLEAHRAGWRRAGRAGRRLRFGARRPHASPSYEARRRWAGWRPASKRRTGIGRSKSSTTTGSAPTAPSWA